MYINLLLDLSREDLRKLFWKCIKIVTDFYNCLLKDFQIYTLPNFFFYNWTTQVSSSEEEILRKASFQVLSLIVPSTPIAKSLRGCNNFWKCYTSILFGKQNPDINQLVFEREIQLFQKRSKKVSMLRKMLTKVSELITVSLRIKRIDLVRGRVKFKFVKLFYLISI